MPELLTEEVTDMMHDQLIMVTALQAIVIESEDAESVRSAAAALFSTKAGRAFVKANPINL